MNAVCHKFRMKGDLLVILGKEDQVFHHNIFSYTCNLCNDIQEVRLVHLYKRTCAGMPVIMGSVANASPGYIITLKLVVAQVSHHACQRMMGTLAQFCMEMWA